MSFGDSLSFSTVLKSIFEITNENIINIYCIVLFHQHEFNTCFEYVSNQGFRITIRNKSHLKPNYPNITLHLTLSINCYSILYQYVPHSDQSPYFYFRSTCGKKHFSK